MPIYSRVFLLCRQPENIFEKVSINKNKKRELSTNCLLSANEKPYIYIYIYTVYIYIYILLYILACIVTIRTYANAIYNNNFLT